VRRNYDGGVKYFINPRGDPGFNISAEGSGARNVN